jgi:hypothetical protein
MLKIPPEGFNRGTEKPNKLKTEYYCGVYMPFTFAHPAAVLPIKYFGRDRLSSTGLIIGSMIPDFEGFFRLSGIKSYSHSIEGIFGFDLPLGLLIAFVFHLLVRNPLIDNLPEFLRSRFAFTRYFNWNTYFKQHAAFVFISLFLGILTHLGWDSLTHTYGYFPVIPLGLELSNNQLIDLQRMLQIVSSIVGLLVIAYALWKLPLQAPQPRKSILGYWSVVGTVTVSVVILKNIFYHRGQDIFNITTSGFLLGLVIASLWYSWFKAGKREAIKNGEAGHSGT